ncbi:MAG: 6-carboxytetrahydropterin synthase [Gammaproteobacteria bacterium]
MAKYIFDEVALLINTKDVKVKEVTVWETARSAVTYSQ